MDMLLETNRIILRYFDGNDSEDLFEYLSDEEVVRYEPYYVYTKEAAQQEAKGRADNPSFIAVCLKDTGKLIGNLYLEKIEPQRIETYEIGYVFNRKYQGMGYATEATACLVDYIFSSLNAHRIIAHCNIKNSASWKLLERLGFRREAERIDNMFFDVDSNGKPLWFSSYQYAMLKTEHQ
jgi:ribosomal-protein-alanine N-acetyltransferase